MRLRVRSITTQEYNAVRLQALNQIAFTDAYQGASGQDQRVLLAMFDIELPVAAYEGIRDQFETFDELGWDYEIDRCGIFANTLCETGDAVWEAREEIALGLTVVGAVGCVATTLGGCTPLASGALTGATAIGVADAAVGCVDDPGVGSCVAAPAIEVIPGEAISSLRRFHEARRVRIGRAGDIVVPAPSSLPGLRAVADQIPGAPGAPGFGAYQASLSELELSIAVGQYAFASQSEDD